MTYLFKAFPVLQKNLPHVSLCDVPTPLVKLEHFGDAVGHKNIFMKADYLTGKKIDEAPFHLYGGNKPRKLEFLLADARAKNAETIVTYGGVGSGCALATTVYAHELGFKHCVLMLKNQPNSPVVRHNLLLDYYYGAELRFSNNNQASRSAAQEILRNSPTAYLIPLGGSNEIGAIGFVNAACELKEQIQQGAVQEPDLIYIPVGSCGSVAGLLLGLQAVGLQSKIVAVGVAPEDVDDEFYDTTKKLFAKTNALLNRLDPSFKVFAFPEDKLIMNKKFTGTQYGLFTQEAVEAIKLFNRAEHVQLEGTYSAKPIAALIDDVAQGVIADKTILYWNTYCGLDYSALTKTVDYKTLPVEFHKYFEEDIQPLSKNVG